MPHRVLLVSLAAILTSCVHVPPLRPALAEQVLPSHSRSAATEVAGVRMTVHPDDWRGWPDDLDNYLTPVEVLVENHSGKEIRIAPHLFSLVGPNGFRYQALLPGEVRQALRSRWQPPVFVYYGYYPWPGFYGPWPDYYPYYWWGEWPTAPSPRPTPQGTLVNGGYASVLVFFPVPVDNLGSLTFEANLVAIDGRQLGQIRAPFVRSDKPVPAESALPPTPPPSQLPPPPPVRPPTPPSS